MANREQEVVEKVDDLYEIGTFGQIIEMQDLGTKLRMVIMGHRRIKLNKLEQSLGKF